MKILQVKDRKLSIIHQKNYTSLNFFSNGHLKLSMLLHFQFIIDYVISLCLVYSSLTDNSHSQDKYQTASSEAYFNPYINNPILSVCWTFELHIILQFQPPIQRDPIQNIESKIGQIYSHSQSINLVSYQKVKSTHQASPNIIVTEVHIDGRKQQGENSRLI